MYLKKKHKLLLAFEEGFCCIDVINHPNTMKQILPLIIPCKVFLVGFIAPTSGILSFNQRIVIRNNSG